MDDDKLQQVGNELFEDGRWEEAATAYRLAIQVRPRSILVALPSGTKPVRVEALGRSGNRLPTGYSRRRRGVPGALSSGASPVSVEVLGRSGNRLWAGHSDRPREVLVAQRSGTSPVRVETLGRSGGQLPAGHSDRPEERWSHQYLGQALSKLNVGKMLQPPTGAPFN